ncbi:MAG: hypothetical protein OHK93_004419 [Ramalina farinacea]|uniref:Uncharacterized protein n=1 Tax=Ramalina farinacea TaxID=258253 RepID=A0AA43QUR5_9LECA|nr:hypothetical protein [Ramalina farinacea]
MLLQPRRLSSLLFIVSTTILTFANIAYAQVSTAYPTTTSAAASTPSPLPTSDAFYLVVADTGTPFDGDYLYLGDVNSLEVLLFGKEPQLADGSVFHLSNGSYGSLTYNPAGLVATYYDLYGALIFDSPDPTILENDGLTPATCELNGGILFCQNTDYSELYTFPSTVDDGETSIPYVLLGPPPLPSGAVGLRLLPIPVE